MMLDSSWSSVRSMTLWEALRSTLDAEELTEDCREFRWGAGIKVLCGCGVRLRSWKEGGFVLEPRDDAADGRKREEASRKCVACDISAKDLFEAILELFPRL